MSRNTSSSTSSSLKMRTVLVGSPMYANLPNCTVFTRLLPRRSSVGMTRGRSTSECREVGEELHAEPVALLRMELRAEHVARFQGCRKGDAIFGGEDGVHRPVRPHEVGVNEI